jgi:tetratricopeptide (TPR) repeat protein
LQEGFVAMEELYGLSPLKVNRFAFLAAAYGDKATAARAFARIGSNWDPTIWGAYTRFESQRKWAGLSDPPQANIASAPSMPAPAPSPSAQVEQMLMLAMKERNEGHWAESTQLAQQAIKTAEPLPGTGEPLGRGYVMIANNDYSLGHIAEAQSMLDRAVSAVSERAGSNSIELASILTQSALSAQVMNDYARAEANLRRSVEIREKANGTSDRELCNDLTILGNLLLLRGRNKDALEIYQRAIRYREAVSADDFFLTQPLEESGVVLAKMGRNQEAEDVFLRVLKLMEGRYGRSNFLLTGTLNALASLYNTTGRPVDGQRILDRIHQIQADIAK